MQGADFRPLQKKIENEMPFFLLFLPCCILSEVSKNSNFSSVHPFLSFQFSFYRKNLYKKGQYYSYVSSPLAGHSFIRLFASVREHKNWQ